MKISIIIPVLNEAARLPALLCDLAGQEPPMEVIVADGGSSDESAAIAKQAGARVIAAPRGRGPQLRAGAEAAVGDAILFLHADSQIGPGGLAAIRQALGDDSVVGGNFRILFDGGDPFAEWLTGFYAWFRKYDIFYGDSGIFIRRSILEALGGVPPLALMEDYELRHRMRRAGRIVCISEPPIETSSRRFRGRHPARVFAGWLLIHALYYLRTPSSWMAAVYDSGRRRTGS